MYLYENFTAPIESVPFLTEKYLEQGSKTHPLIQIRIDARRNFCTAAVPDGIFKFFDDRVPEGRVYELQSSAGNETVVGIPCPVVPPLFVYQKDLSSPVNVIMLKSAASDYTFGVAEFFMEMSKFIWT